MQTFIQNTEFIIRKFIGEVSFFPSVISKSINIFHTQFIYMLSKILTYNMKKIKQIKVSQSWLSDIQKDITMDDK